MPKIEVIYAYIAYEKGDPDKEGLTAFLPGPSAQWMPMVGADEERMASLKPMAQELANATGQRITLVKFSDRTDLETIDPKREEGFNSS